MITREIVIFDAQALCGDVLEFNRYKNKLNKFIYTSNLKDGEGVSGKGSSIDWESVGISNVFRKGRFIFFVLKKNGLLIDDGTSVFFYDLERGGGVIEEIMKETKFRTFHIQYVPGEPGWYFWEYMW